MHFNYPPVNIGARVSIDNGLSPHLGIDAFYGSYQFTEERITGDSYLLSRFHFTNVTLINFGHGVHLLGLPNLSNAIIGNDFTGTGMNIENFTINGRSHV